MDLLEELEARVLCGDGAIGTLLLADGIPLERCFEELCLSAPERIRTIHEQYIGAGARLIETNTFGANAVRLERFDLSDHVAEINRAAVALAKSAARGKPVWVGGSVGPLGLTAEEAQARGVDREQCFREQLTGLLEAEVDLIFFETFMDLEEMEIALRAKTELSSIPAICSFACSPKGQLTSGEMLPDAFGRVRELGAKIVGVNCLNDPNEMLQLLKHLPAQEGVAVYPTAGQPQYREGKYEYPVSPDSFAMAARALVAAGARLLGGCCGTTPDHIAALTAALRAL